MKKVLVYLMLFAIVGGLVYGIWTWDWTAPTIQWEGAAAQVGRDSRIVLNVLDEGNGLNSISADVIQGDSRQNVFRESYPHRWAPWAAGVSSRSVALTPATSFTGLELKPGAFQIEVRANDQPYFGLFGRETVDSRSFEYDLTPPRVEVLSQQHYIRQGGSEAVLYRPGEDAVSSGVQVGDNQFHGSPVKERPGEYLCIFALEWKQDPDTPIFLWAQDAAGNSARIDFWRKVFPQRFRERDIEVTDAFIQATVPEIISNSPQVSHQGSALQDFRAVNADLRRINNQFIAELSRQSADHILWQQPFLQLSNSQVESAFADHRTYFYQGQPVDEQTHLGFDLATVRNGPVEASNDGLVLYSDYLGIYGNTIILDHGLGVLSLYGHLNSMQVQKGERVSRGQTIGRTGDTGLAAGDHLHFTMVVQGVQVNPVEWWDEKWLRERILSRLAGGDYGRAQPAPTR